MNLNEIKQPSDQKLFEEIDAQNDTGFSTEDLVKIERAKTGPWSEPLTADEMIAKLREFIGG